MNKANNIVNISLVILQNTKKQILLLQRPKNVHCPSCWSFPGGKIKPTETAFHAAQRELQEETAVGKINQWTTLGHFEFNYPEGHFHFHLFQTHIVENQPIQSSEKHIWADINTLHTFTMPEANQQFIPLIQQLNQHNQK